MSIFGEKKDREYYVDLLVEAISKSVVKLEPGNKYVLVIPDDGTDAEKERYARILEERLQLQSSNIKFVVVFARWAKLIEIA